MLYHSSSSRIAQIPFTTSQLPRTTAERLRARDRTPLIGRPDVALTVRTKLDNTHWLPSTRACPLVNPPLKHLMYATLIIIVYIYIYNIYMYIIIYIYVYIYIIIYIYIYIYICIGSVRFLCQSPILIFSLVQLYSKHYCQNSYGIR